MDYVFDSSSFIVMGHYFPGQFASFWRQLDSCVARGRVISVGEVFRELDRDCSRTHLRDWVQANKAIFVKPTDAETTFVAKIFAVQHFRQVVTQKQRLKGTPVADPFVVASAAVNNRCVVTEESLKENAAKIPNICRHFQIRFVNLEGFMSQEGWQF